MSRLKDDEFHLVTEAAARELRTNLAQARMSAEPKDPLAGAF